MYSTALVASTAIRLKSALMAGHGMGHWISPPSSPPCLCLGQGTVVLPAAIASSQMAGFSFYQIVHILWLGRR